MINTAANKTISLYFSGYSITMLYWHKNINISRSRPDL